MAPRSLAAAPVRGGESGSGLAAAVVAGCRGLERTHARSSGGLWCCHAGGVLPWWRAFGLASRHASCSGGGL
eukprot:6301563-Prymnesium_polylepis.1